FRIIPAPFRNEQRKRLVVELLARRQFVLRGGGDRQEGPAGTRRQVFRVGVGEDGIDGREIAVGEKPVDAAENQVGRVGDALLSGEHVKRVEERVGHSVTPPRPRMPPGPPSWHQISAPRAGGVRTPPRSGRGWRRRERPRTSRRECVSGTTDTTAPDSRCPSPPTSCRWRGRSSSRG